MPCNTRRSSTPDATGKSINGPGFTGAVDIPKDVWFHLRLEVTGAQAKLYVKDMDKPALVMDDLKSGVQKGQVALYVLTGADLLLEFRSTDNARRALGTAPAADAAEHSDQVEHLARLRCAGAESGASAHARRKRCHPVAGCGGGTARLCGPLSLSSRPRIRGSRFREIFRSAWNLSRE